MSSSTKPMQFEREPLAAVAQVLKKMRLARGWSTEELAKKAGVRPTTVLAYEAAPASLSESTALQVFEAIPLHPEDRLSFQDTFLITPPHEVVTHMQARLNEVEGAAFIDQGNLTEALDRLDFVVVLRPRRDHVGRIHLSRAAVLGELGKTERALDAIRKAEDCFSLTRDPHLWLRLRLEQLYLLCQQERFHDAEARLAETESLADRAGRPWEHLQVRRLAGWIAAGSGREDEALRILQPVCREMLAGGMAFEGLSIALDLASTLADRGSPAEVEELADQVQPWIENKKLSHDARTTLKVFCWSVRRGTFTAAMGRQLAGELRRSGSRLRRPYEIPGCAQPPTTPARAPGVQTPG
jgi:transcriptional regulator with XRE-family HTH domain